MPKDQTWRCRLAVGHYMDGPFVQLESEKSWIATSAAEESEILLAGDSEQVLERLHRKYYPSFLRFFARKGCHRDTCEDLTQDIFVRLCRSLATFDGRSKLETWLYTVARNVWRNEVREALAGKREGREFSLDAEPAEDGWLNLESRDPGPVGDLLERERVECLRAALEKLPPRMQRCARHRFVHGLKYREIATLEQVKIDTVKSQLGQAREKLRIALRSVSDKAEGDGSSEESK